MRYDNLNTIIKTYGKESQINVAIEEMSELTKELCKSKRGFDNLDKIAEELADVQIMLHQLFIMLPDEYRTLVTKTYDYKIDRQLERIRGNGA